MKNNFFTKLFFLLTIVSVVFIEEVDAVISQQQKLIYDYIFLLDTSGSMEGLPIGSNNTIIFPKVKAAVNEILNSIEHDASVFVYPFDKGIHDSQQFEIRDQSDIDDAIDYINQLPAQGSRTWIYRSLKNVIDKSFNEKGHSVRIYLFTDGLDNDIAKQYSMTEITKEYELKRGERDFLYYCTLGVELPEKEIIILEETPGLSYVPATVGKVPVPHEIIAELSLLNYGNLLKTGTGVETQIFNIPNKKSIHKDLKITVQPDFPALESMGVYAEVKPKSFTPREKVDIELSFENIENLGRGIYEGTYTFTTNYDLVFVVPNIVNVKFSYEDERTAAVSLANGEKFPINFGKLKTYKEETPENEKILILEYNKKAIEEGGSLQLRCTPSVDNPSLLSSENILINNEENNFITILPTIDKIPFRIVATKDLKTGKYKGTLNFESEDVIVTGKGLKNKKNEPNKKFIYWSFVVPRKPLPLWFWVIVLLLIAGGIFGVIKYKTKPPVISDLKLDIIEPNKREIDLAGRTEVKFGKDGEDFLDIESSFVIRAKKEYGKVFVVLEIKNGDVYLIKAGERDKSTIFVAEKIFDGDKIIFGNYIARVSSFYLIRE